MNEKEELKKFNTELGEDATKYGEFISSYFAWITPKEQKKKAEKFQKITKNKNE
ncbi:MAG: hypothetical protein HFJ53_00795 [Clostridia bacterium]|jgi:hypothetical protein|nr:hypothetical protein [Clostridia bacterium]